MTKNSSITLRIAGYRVLCFCGEITRGRQTAMLGSVTGQKPDFVSPNNGRNLGVRVLRR